MISPGLRRSDASDWTREEYQAPGPVGHPACAVQRRLRDGRIVLPDVSCIGTDQRSSASISSPPRASRGGPPAAGAWWLAQVLNALASNNVARPAPSSPEFDSATRQANLAAQEASSKLPRAPILGADQTMPVQDKKHQK
jgi:hypothetical protein